MLRFGGKAGERQTSPRTVVIGAALGIAASGGVMAETLAQPASSDLERRAADYVSFRADVAAVEAAPITSPKATRDAHKLLSTHNSKSLSSGWVAYAALVAADTPEFAKAIEAEVAGNKKKNKKGQTGRDAFLAKLAENPDYVMTIPGAKAAIDRVVATTAQDSARFAALGESFKQQAYSMQRTAWGKKQIGAGSARNAEAASFGADRPEFGVPTLQPAVNGGVTSPVLTSLDKAWSPSWGADAKPAAGALEPNASVVMSRVLTLAARYGVGAANETVVDLYAKNDRADQCLSLAALTLKQCIAATRTPYEEAFCLGEHSLNDTSRCIGWVAESGPQGS